VLKYGIGQRQRVSSASYLERAQANLESSSAAAASGTTQEQDGMEVDGIEAMMAGVKSRGVLLLSHLHYCTITDILFDRARNC
jgi:hypothetical protein